MANCTSEIRFCAVPYDITAPAFYFDDEEEYNEQYDAARAKRGTEEYEIQWIDGPELYREVWAAGPSGQSHLSDYFEFVETEDDHDLMVWVALAKNDSCTFNRFNREAMDSTGFNASFDTMKNVAYDRRAHMSIETLKQYFDADSYARTMACSGAWETKVDGQTITIEM